MLACTVRCCFCSPSLFVCCRLMTVCCESYPTCPCHVPSLLAEASLQWSVVRSHGKLLVENFEWRTARSQQMGVFELLIIEGGFSVLECHHCQWLSMSTVPLLPGSCSSWSNEYYRQCFPFATVISFSLTGASLSLHRNDDG